MNRRRFITSASALAALAATQNLRSQSPSSPKRRVGVIGCGWYGGVNLLRLSQVEAINVVALCDVDSDALEKTLHLVSAFQSAKPATFADYRKMLAQRKLDIVIVATPDHWHALPAIAAMQAGADIYLEKPISHDVIEGEALVAAARKYNRVVQVNTQRRSMPHVVAARRNFIETGKLGRIGWVEGYCYFHMRSEERRAESSPPPSLDFELWTGPAAHRPYAPAPWRAFMEYGNGIVGDMCVHMLDTARWMLDLGWPKSVSSNGGILVDTEAAANITDTQRAQFDFEALQFSWEHRSWGRAGKNAGQDWTKQWGIVIHGDRGALELTSIDYDFHPAGGERPVHADAVNEAIDKSNSNYDAIDLAAAVAERQHMRNFLEAIDRRERPVADIEEGHISSASCILANLSLELGRPLAYDPKTRSIPDDPQATRLLRRPYRAPWIHPEPDQV